MGLENQLLASRIATVNQPGSPPGPPDPNQAYRIPGQAVTGPKSTPGRFAINPFKVDAGSKTHPSQEPAAHSDVGWTRTRNGWKPVMSRQSKERLEEDIIGWTQWQMRNRLGPMSGVQYYPPPVPLKKGYQWYYHPLHGDYRQVPTTWYRPNMGFLDK